MRRRDFMKRLTATAAGLLVADDALEMLLEPRRKLWAGADLRCVKIGAADIYISDFATISIIPSRIVRHRDLGYPNNLLSLA